jgi:hypothetical protein
MQRKGKLGPTTMYLRALTALARCTISITLLIFSISGFNDRIVAFMQLMLLGWNIVMTASMVELYNEDLRDLLAGPTSSEKSDRSDRNGLKRTESSVSMISTNSNADKEKLTIVFKNGIVQVVGLTAVEINCTDTK